jgi:hypothetical protein
LFSDLYQRPLVLSFDQRQGSSDGGAVLLQAANRIYGLIESMTACLPFHAERAQHLVPPISPGILNHYAC